jgi:hypothetical protein
LLEVWLDSPYCRRKNIGKDTVAQVIRAALLTKPGNADRLISD